MLVLVVYLRAEVAEVEADLVGGKRTDALQAADQLVRGRRPARHHLCLAAHQVRNPQ